MFSIRMDIKSAVLNQLNTDSLYSLMIQNHLYGCFIIMEDIAQHKVNVDGTVISTPKFTFDLDKQFSEIGLRYGFAMDTKLALNTFNPEYKETWLRQFKDIDIAQNIEEVDKIEESLIEIIQTIKSEDAFFISALETGTLPQEWIGKILNLLNLDVELEDVKIENRAISVALTEKPILILTFFYKQAVCEFRINQIEWSQVENLSTLLTENVPVVIRSIPSATFWTHEDVLARSCFKDIPIFQETSLTDWISSSTPDSICPWKYQQAETIANVSGINIWANKWINPHITRFKFWMFPKYNCWAGNITKDTPFVADLKFIDIILRPGNCIFMPAHWFVSWTTTPTSNKTPMVCTISYHTPISLLAFMK